jgi:hypothetical protein
LSRRVEVQMIRVLFAAVAGGTLAMFGLLLLLGQFAPDMQYEAALPRLLVACVVGAVAAGGFVYKRRK